MWVALNDFYTTVSELEVEAFLSQSQNALVLDVRSEKEFVQGHIKGAVHLALLDDSTRAFIGRVYKEKGRDAAIEAGYSLLAPHMAGLQNFVQRIYTEEQRAMDLPLYLYCWRGGDRSTAMSIILNKAGFVTKKLLGGYKAFRRYVLDSFSYPYQLQILGGHTGSGKTELLHCLERRGEQVIDLEAIAQHRGSAFGQYGEKKQGTCEQFENNLAFCLSKMDKQRCIWLEDESIKLGALGIPKEFFMQMKEASAVWLERSLNERLDCLMQEYGNMPDELLGSGLDKIKKRLGLTRYVQAQELLAKGRKKDLAELLLKYYDCAYEKQRKKRGFALTLPHLDLTRTVESLLLYRRSIEHPRYNE